MSTFDYSRAVATAKRMIDKYGVGAQIRVTSKTGPAYNPTVGGTTDYPCSAVIFDYTMDEIDKSQGRLLQTDKHLYMAASGLTVAPSSDYQLALPDAVYRIIPPLKPLAPGGIVIYYDLQCRL